MNALHFYDNKNVVCGKVRYYRKKRKLSQTQLAAKLQVMNLNIDQQMISKIERNKRIVTDFELACLCRALRVSLTEMLSDFYEKYPE